jgi:membrane fusion protein (multidrug efflux system)
VRIGFGILALLLLIPACDPGPPESRRDVPVPVVAEVAARQPVLDVVDTVGRVEAESVSHVGTQLPGRIVEMTREVGDLIPGTCGEPKRDQAALLAKLDTDQLEAQLKRLDAEVRLAETNVPELKREYERQERLLEEGSGTAQRRDQAKMAYEAALARVDAAKAARREVQVRIEKSHIYAPMDAVVVEKYANVGDVVDPMMNPRLYRLECIRDLKIQVIVPERDVPDVKAQKQAAITFDALPGYTFTGTIHTLVPSGDPVSHSFTAEIRFRNHTAAGPLPEELPKDLGPDDLLVKPGMFARVKIVKYRKPDAVVVPNRCVVEAGDDTFVYRIVGGVAKKTPVWTGIAMGTVTEITSGLAAGQHVVGRGIENVTEGQPVRVIGVTSEPATATRTPPVSAGG